MKCGEKEVWKYANYWKLAMKGVEDGSSLLKHLLHNSDDDDAAAPLVDDADDLKFAQNMSEYERLFCLPLKHQQEAKTWSERGLRNGE